jgi:predicted DNA-binding WGR domain protein
VQIRLERINHVKRQSRYYVLSVSETLFGEWCLTQESGSIGANAGIKRTDYMPSRADAVQALLTMKDAKTRSGYAPIPVQLPLL